VVFECVLGRVFCLYSVFLVEGSFMIVGIEFLGYCGSLEGLMGPGAERNEDKGYVGVRELS